MKNSKFIIIHILLYISISSIYSQNIKQKYSANPNHRDLAIKAFQLAVDNEYSDSNISNQEIQNRIEAGAYSEDYEDIPGIIGNHFPDPWLLGPSFNFVGLHPITKIPYGKLTSTTSGWYRSFMHGYDPVQDFVWPGATETTIEWANSIYNSYTWDKAIALYNNREWEKAYQCLGHILHLLADLSVPAHVMIIDHGASLKSKNSGTIWDPDIGKLVVDEYERALNGGLELPNYPGIYFVPNLLAEFRNALDSSSVGNIPVFINWQTYLDSLARYTYNHPTVNLYYSAPDSNGMFGYLKDTLGAVVNPFKYANTPPGEIDGRWTQFELYGTFDINNLPAMSIIPKNDMKRMCKDLVPKAVEFGAGLIFHFKKIFSGTENFQDVPRFYKLEQNYPNPFNPSTTIQFQIPKTENVRIEIFNLLGQRVETLLDKSMPAGNHEIKFTANNLPCGAYFYKINAGSFHSVRKMLLIK